MVVSIETAERERSVCESTNRDSALKRMKSDGFDHYYNPLDDVVCLDPQENFWLGDWKEDVLDALTVHNVDIVRFSDRVDARKSNGKRTVIRKVLGMYQLRRDHNGCSIAKRVNIKPHSPEPNYSID